jgi:hypothetical protein
MVGRLEAHQAALNAGDAVAETEIGQPVTQQQTGGLCGRMMSWLRNSFSIQGAIKLVVVGTITYLARNAISQIDTSSWDHECPVSRDSIVQRYERAFQEHAHHSLTMHQLWAPNRQPDETAICLTTSWPYLLDEIQGIRCYSNGRQIPVEEVQTSDMDCQLLAATSCLVNCSSTPRDQPHKKIKLQHSYH